MNQSGITGWWFESLWKILVNGKDDIPYIMENKKCSKPSTSDIWLIIDCLIIYLNCYVGNFILLWTNQPDYETQHFEPINQYDCEPLWL